MKKLEKLSKEQLEIAEQIKNEWIDLFFNIKKIDEPSFEEGINWVYEDILKKSEEV